MDDLFGSSDNDSQSSDREAAEPRIVTFYRGYGVTDTVGLVACFIYIEESGNKTFEPRDIYPLYEEIVEENDIFVTDEEWHQRFDAGGREAVKDLTIVKSYGGFKDLFPALLNWGVIERYGTDDRYRVDTEMVESSEQAIAQLESHTSLQFPDAR